MCPCPARARFCAVAASDSVSWDPSRPPAVPTGAGAGAGAGVRRPEAGAKKSADPDAKRSCDRGWAHLIFLWERLKIHYTFLHRDL